MHGSLPSVTGNRNQGYGAMGHIHVIVKFNTTICGN